MPRAIENSVEEILTFRLRNQWRRAQEAGGIRPLPEPGLQLEGVLQGQLKEARIRCVVLEELRSGNQATIRVVVGDGGITQRWMIQHIECIRAELQILLSPSWKALEQGHVDLIVARSIHIVLPAA
jgi:hypothetical protein